jgi:perosamine synthetase
VKSSASQHESLAQSVVGAIRGAVGVGPVALHEPRFRGNEWVYVKECIDTTFVSSIGKFVDRFETDLAAYTGAKHAVAVVNGTAALHIALLLAGVERDDEVLVPALTFVATATAVMYCNAVPHFVDSREYDLGMDPRALAKYLHETCERRSEGCWNRRTGRRVRAMVPMHTFGHPVDIVPLTALAEEFGIVLVEDAAESLGSLYCGRHTGTFGMLGTLSFNGNKTITTGGGGAIITNDAELARRAKHLTTTAKVPHPWEYEHDAVGYNYRLPNINAALGCAQLEQLNVFIQSKRQLHDRYREAFRGLQGVRVVTEPEGCRSNYWLNAILLDEGVAAARDTVLQATNDEGLMTRPAWTLLHRLQSYASCPRAPTPCAESIARRLINIPSSAGIA